MKLESIRREYTRAELSKKNADKHPMHLFQRWMKEVLNLNKIDATSMSIVTNGADGFPDSRIVLLKSYNNEGFVFFTNYNSQKGQAIAENPKVSLHFFWPELERQVRISGIAEKTSIEESEAYFHSRPFESQVAAAVSDQSAEVPSRVYLEEKFDALKKELNGTNPERPKNWGGYLVRPVKFEFWQGRENRLHDRIVYELKDEDWIIKRLAP
ncbi:pyridoxamine 5'-phosphate oxidase [Maribellus sediminis]|uniref:pyridoxamine 5'-phosphate oxidase n=1 Tax=Maribellus sediminis TaxID=2696285 RepID=UPI0014318F51|nr:pyridoxamine 5'-phosphate oxidase [Maribellus sediminis]